MSEPSYKMRLSIKPVGNFYGRPRWEWCVEGEKVDKTWGIMSTRNGEVCYTVGEVEEGGAVGKARTKLGALRVGHRAIKRMQKLLDHVDKKGVVIEP